jgi:hypothetical protein
MRRHFIIFTLHVTKYQGNLLRKDVISGTCSTLWKMGKS